MTLDFWFLLIIALIFCASILTAWMLSEHFRLGMEQVAVDRILNTVEMHDTPPWTFAYVGSVGLLTACWGRMMETLTSPEPKARGDSGR